MLSGLFDRFCSNRLAALFARLAAVLTPPLDKLKKLKNALSAPYAIYHQLPKTISNPMDIRIAPITICNYNCLFCEIHKDNLLYPERSKNVVDLDVIRNYESFLSTAFSLSFYGGSEEPLLNNDFGRIVRYLKSKYGTRLMVNTNASPLNHELADIMVTYGFDIILVSYHAGSKQAYKKLMTGNIDHVDANLKYLNEQKKRCRKEKPVVQFNFALQKLNAPEYSIILSKAKELDVSAVFVNKYYGGRNRLQDKRVSFDSDIDRGNRVLDEIYACAKKQNIRLCPDKPDYWIQQSCQWDPENFDASKKCTLPWTALHFNPVLDDKDCHYVGVCNRIELFKIAYDKIQLRTQKQFDTLWNHPLLQYLRKTANAAETINPICRNCKNRDIGTLRNVDARKYAELRDRAVKDFFAEFRRHCRYSETQGIEVLTENPYSDDKFQEKLATLDA